MVDQARKMEHNSPYGRNANKEAYVPYRAPLLVRATEMGLLATDGPGLNRLGTDEASTAPPSLTRNLSRFARSLALLPTASEATRYNARVNTS